MNFKSSLFWTTLAISAFIWCSSIGSCSFFNANLSWGEWYASWQRQAFSGLCHQQTDRMFLLKWHAHGGMFALSGDLQRFFAGIVLLPFFLPQHRLRSSLIIPFIICFGSPEHCRCTHVCAFSLGQHLVFPGYAAGSFTRTHDCDFYLWQQKNPQRPFNHLHYGNSK